MHRASGEYKNTCIPDCSHCVRHRLTTDWERHEDSERHEDGEHLPTIPRSNQRLWLAFQRCLQSMNAEPIHYIHLLALRRKSRNKPSTCLLATVEPGHCVALQQRASLAQTRSFDVLEGHTPRINTAVLSGTCTRVSVLGAGWPFKQGALAQPVTRLGKELELNRSLSSPEPRGQPSARESHGHLASYPSWVSYPKSSS